MEHRQVDNIHMMRDPEGTQGEKGAESLFQEIMAENFPNWGKEMDIQIREAGKTPHKMNPKNSHQNPL